VLSVEGGDEFYGLREGDMEVVRGIYLLPVAIDYERVLAEQAVFHNFITLIYWMQAVTHCLKRSREQYSAGLSGLRTVEVWHNYQIGYILDQYNED
jgi:hypothetical protein